MENNEKQEYYMEWWKIGSPANVWSASNFHTADIQTFVGKFLALKKYTIVYLRREKDLRVMKDARNTLQ